MRRALLLVGAATALLPVSGGCGGSNSSGGGDGGAGPQNGGNVEFAPTCSAQPACGGDPNGTWEVVQACAEIATVCSTATGTMTGSLTISTSAATFSLDFNRKLTTCVGSNGAGNGDSGPLKITATTLDLGQYVGVFQFCVQGDTLTLSANTLKYPNVASMVLTRRLADAGGGG